MKTDLERGRSSAFYCTPPASFCKRRPAFVELSIIFAIVGYAQSALREGNTLVTAQFLNIGAEVDTALQSIKPTGDGTSDAVSIQTLDSVGRAVDTYIWCDWAGEEGDQEAWSDGSGEIIEGVKFAPGTALWIQGTDANQGIQTAGAVGTSDVVVQLCAGNTAIGNPFPVAVDLQDIVPEGDGTSDNVSIQTLDSAGRAVDTYIWCDWAGEEGDQEAWSDGSGEIIEGVKFAPGAGLWIQGSSDAQSIRFPAPEL